MPDQLREPSRPATELPQRGGLLKLVGSGIVTGAADDDPSAIGTHASVGAKYGLAARQPERPPCTRPSCSTPSSRRRRWLRWR